MNARPKTLAELREQHEGWEFRRIKGVFWAWKVTKIAELSAGTAEELSAAVDLAEALQP